MANASSEDAGRERERPAQASQSSSLGSSVLVRAAAFVVLMFVVGYSLDALMSVGILKDSEMMNVVVGIFLSLGFLAIFLSVVVGALILIRRARR